MLFTEKDPNFAEGLTNFAENLFKNGTPQSSVSLFIPCLPNTNTKNPANGIPVIQILYYMSNFAKSPNLNLMKMVYNKAKAISAKPLELNLKINLKKRGKQDQTGRNRKTGRKTPKTGRNWMILKKNR